METMTVNVEKVPKELWKEFGIQALKEDLDKRELFIKVLEKYLIENSKKEGK